jgi:hypothetical protein
VDQVREAQSPAPWLQPLRKQGKSRRAWVPPAHLLVAAALLLVSCLHYLAKPTGGSTAVHSHCRFCVVWIPASIKPAHPLVASFATKQNVYEACTALLHPSSGHPGLEHLKWLAVAAAAIGLPVVLLRAVAGLRRGLLDINILMTVAVAGTSMLRRLYRCNTGIQVSKLPFCEPALPCPEVMQRPDFQR